MKVTRFFFVLLTLLTINISLQLIVSNEANAADHWIDGDNVFSYYVRDESVNWSSSGLECDAIIIKTNRSSEALINSLRYKFTYIGGEWFYISPTVKGYNPITENLLMSKILNYLLTLR